MSFLEVLGNQTINLVELSNSVNKIVFQGYSNILKDLSQGLDLKGNIGSHDKQDLVELAHKINIIKDLDSSTDDYINHLREIFLLEKKMDNNKSLLRDIKDSSLDLLDLSTSINRLIISSVSDLFNTVSNSVDLQEIVDNDNINLSSMIDKVEVVKKLDNVAYNVFRETEDLL